MHGAYRNPETTVISLLPLRFHWKKDFINMLSDELSRQGYSVRAFQWKSLGLRRTNFIVLHWPDEFFVNRGIACLLKAVIKLGIIYIAKIRWRAKIVWVAHNAAPHDADNQLSTVRGWFLRSLDGVVFLSEYSRRLIVDLYPEIAKCKSLATVHGHYRGTSVTQETPSRMPSDIIQLVQFGQIRPYKNIEVLIDAVASTSSGFHLLVAGMAMDRALCLGIKARAQLLPHITLDFRDAPISDVELEAIVDGADAVVLPYKNILNSGSALFSLSRNRPILAPNMGSLPELRDTVGEEWIYLYDGEFRQEVLLDFREWMLTTRRARVAPLDGYGLSRIGDDLRRFIGSMN
jgi:beta-1,4-mannosyltransferase